jgi:hypothetical protein
MRERIADEHTLMVAGMCRFLGSGGESFVLDQTVLAILRTALHETFRLRRCTPSA